MMLPGHSQHGGNLPPRDPNASRIAIDDPTPEDPIVIWDTWWREAKEALGVHAHTMFLATVNPTTMRPACRAVLMKEFNHKGVQFFTNYSGRKASEIALCPNVATTFYWSKPVGRSVRVEGKVHKLTAEESDVYFSTRPRGSAIGAHASNQSRELSSREELLQRVAEIEAKYPASDDDHGKAGGTVPRPEDWGGFLIVPDVIEFWEEDSYRLHHRLQFRKGAEEKWEKVKLFP
eukprot:PhF_6_TR22676/c0_g1_i3/m.32289/K00275/pdxH, PNPO; pyridoxamine 5'-phosphate oxidase